MPGNASVLVTFAADSMAEAQGVVDGWTLQPGCQVVLNYTETAPPSQTDDSGSVVPVPPDPDPNVQYVEGSE